MLVFLKKITTTVKIYRTIYSQIWLADWLVANNPNKPRVQEGDYIVEEPDD